MDSKKLALRSSHSLKRCLESGDIDGARMLLGDAGLGQTNDEILRLLEGEMFQIALSPADNFGGKDQPKLKEKIDAIKWLHATYSESAEKDEGDEPIRFVLEIPSNGRGPK